MTQSNVSNPDIVYSNKLTNKLIANAINKSIAHAPNAPKN